MTIRRRDLLLTGAALPFLKGCGSGDDASGGPGDDGPGDDGSGSLEGLSWDEMWRVASEPYGGELRVLSSGGREGNPAYSGAADDFEELTGIHIEVDAAALEDMHTQTLLDMSTQAGDIDIVSINYPWMGSYMANGGLEPLEPYLNDDRFPPVDTDIYIPSLLDAYGTWDDGQIVGLPFLGDAMIFYYNREHFEAAGLDPDQPPTDWDEVISFGEQLTTDDRFGYALMGGRQNQATSQYSAVLFALGQDFYDEGGRPLFDSDEGVEAMRIIAEGLTRISPSAAATWGFDEAVAGFADGACSMSLQWPGALWSVLDPDAAVFGQVGYGPPPVRGPLGGWGIGVNAYSDNKEAAWLWVNYATSLPVQEEYLPQGYNITAESLFEDADVSEEEFPFLPQVGEALANGQSWPRTPETQEVFSLINKWMSSAVTGEATPEEAARGLNDEATALRAGLGLID